ncbi:MAG: hypothetical protein OQK46_09005 [Gammaproteobacteria bacterium]|nr:hypothetical protein [Gammaproteobacteria bacterium]
MKYIILTLLAVFVSSCSSSYTPSEQMLALKKTMTGEQARTIIEESINDLSKLSGICGARGFWFDDKANIQVFENKIFLNAYKRGKELKNTNRGFNDIVVFEKEYYAYDFEFNKLVAINLYDDPLLLTGFPDCYKKDLNKNNIIIDLYADKLNNIKFIVNKKDFDKVMAALSLLLVDIPVEIK